MANHSFITSRKIFKQKQVIKDVEEILAKHVRKNYTIQYEGDAIFIDVWHDDKVYYTAVHMWIANKNKLEFRNRFPGEFGTWIHFLIQNELALKYNGHISDEGVNETWRGEPNKYDTYKAYIEKKASFRKNRVIKTMIKILAWIDKPKGWKDAKKI